MWERLKKLKGFRGWYIWRLKFVDARLYFISIFVGLVTGMVAVPYHYLLRYLFKIRRSFFDYHPKWYWYVAAFALMWACLVFAAWMVKKLPFITGGGIPQTRAVINGRISYKHPLLELLAKFAGGLMPMFAGLSLGREGPSVQFGSYVGCIFSRWGRLLKGEQKQLLAAGAGAGLSAAFAAPLSSSLLVIETIERFDAPKTAITTLTAGVMAGAVARWLMPLNGYHLISVIAPSFDFWSFCELFAILSLLIAVVGKIYAWLATFFRRGYAKIKIPFYIKMLILVTMGFVFSLYDVELTGGGEQFLLDQAIDGSTEMLWLTLMMSIHLFFTLFCISSGLPGGSFIPTLVTGGLLGRIAALYMVHRGFIGYESVNYIMLVCMSAFLVAVIRTPLTAIVLITEITGNLDVFYPSIVVGGITYYLTELLQIKPYNNALYDDMIKSPVYQSQQRYMLNVEIMTGSFFDGKKVDELTMPNECKIVNIHRDRKDWPPAGMVLVPGDQVAIEMNSDDIEKLYEPLTSMANIY